MPVTELAGMLNTGAYMTGVKYLMRKPRVMNQEDYTSVLIFGGCHVLLSWPLSTAAFTVMLSIMILEITAPPLFFRTCSTGSSSILYTGILAWALLKICGKAIRLIKETGLQNLVYRQRMVNGHRTCISRSL